MATLKSIWFWFDGKKTDIGAGIMLFALGLSQFDQQVIINIWHLANPSWFDPSIETLKWIGEAVAGIGFGHKLLKSKQS